MVKGIMIALVLVIASCVFAAIVLTQEQQKRIEARDQRQQDSQANLVECVVNSLSQQAKDQIAHEQVDANGPARLNKFRWYGGLPFVDTAWKVCNRKLGTDFENGIAHDEQILQRLKKDRDYLESLKKWKRVQAGEVARFDEEAREGTAGQDKAGGPMYRK